MIRFRWILVPLALFLLSAIPESVPAQDLTMVWEFKVKAGLEPAFEEAIKAHMDFRKAHGDPWEWRFFQQIIGKDVGIYMARSPGHSWADLDEDLGGEFEEAADNHWNATVAPLVEEVWNLIDQENAELSRLPENMDPYTLFNVSVFYLKPDQIMAFSEAVGKYRQVVIDNDYPFYWVVQTAVAGADGPAMALVGFAEHWTEMAEDPAFEAALMEAYGEEGMQELFQQFYGSFRYFENYIGVLRPDLAGG